ncbi:hypothetical protein EDC04DRAFT_2680200, partial [Pisolithus marmoratus]
VLQTAWLFGFCALLMTGPIGLFQRLSSTTAFTANATSSTPRYPKELPPKGYLIGIHAGVKKIHPNRPNPPLDLAFVLSTSLHRTAAAACFTLNAFYASPEDTR